MMWNVAEILCLATLTYIFYLSWDYFRSRLRVGGLDKKCVFITGCDSGFGHALAVRLDSLGVPVFAGCFTDDGGRELTQSCSERLHTVKLDVTSPESIKLAYQHVRSHLPQGAVLWGVVNNAGIATSRSPVEFTTRQDHLDVLAVNFLGTVEVTATFFPLLKKSKGRIVNMSSVCGIVPWPCFPTYVASKYAVKGYTDLLSLEMGMWGISVSCIMPGPFHTNLGNAHTKEALQARWDALPAEIREEYGEDYVERVLTQLSRSFGTIPRDVSPVIDAYEHALFARKPRAHYYPGFPAKMWLFLSCLPWTWQEVMVKRMFKTPPPKNCAQ